MQNQKEQIAEEYAKGFAKEPSGVINWNKHANYKWGFYDGWDKCFTFVREMYELGKKCYQDRCEGAFVEASVVKKLESELRSNFTEDGTVKFGDVLLGTPEEINRALDIAQKANTSLKDKNEELTSKLERIQDEVQKGSGKRKTDILLENQSVEDYYYNVLLGIYQIINAENK